jgi:acetyl esterase/lipase
MNRWLAACALTACLSVAIAAEVLHPRVPLWPNGAPGSEARRTEPEIARDYWIRNIHDPSITVYLPPAGKATGAGVVIAPGGGHRLLVYEAEGKDPAEFLTGLGVAAFVLKYRLAREEGSPYRIERDAPADAYRAIRTVRKRASEWHVDPKRIGLMGFSAGGEVVSMVAFGPGTGDRTAVDPIDREEGRPDFAIFIYPGPLGVPDVVPPTAPPAFLAAAADDPCCAAPTLKLLQGYHAAKVPVEAHIFAAGGHGFNMGQRSTRQSVHTWPQRLAAWLSDSGWLAPASSPQAPSAMQR